MTTTGTGTTRHARTTGHCATPHCAAAHHDTCRATTDALPGAVPETGTGAPAGGAEAAWELTAEPRAASRARALTARTMRGWNLTDPDDIGDVVLMVGELVANAVVHGTGPVRLTLRLDGRRLHAEVADADPSLPAPPAEPPPADRSEAGRGLLLVAALSAEHGARADATGKTVWFIRLLAPPAGHPPSPRR